MALTMLALYDIVVDRRRAKLAAYLQQWGDRLQYSVFLVRVPIAEFDGFLAHATEILDCDEDSLIVVRLCKPCHEGITTVGQSDISEPPIYRAVF